MPRCLAAFPGRSGQQARFGLYRTIRPCRRGIPCPAIRRNRSFLQHQCAGRSCPGRTAVAEHVAMNRRIFGITGWKNSGKTTLTERLVAELVRRGWKVSTVKHAHHHFDIDKPGADSFRHRQAGATEVAIVSGNRWALMHELRGEREPPLDAILSRLAP